MSARNFVLNKFLNYWYGANLKVGARVRKRGTKGQWQGIIVGFYSTDITPVGYAVESEREFGSVQIYPETALEVL